MLALKFEQDRKIFNNRVSAKNVFQWCHRICTDPGYFSIFASMYYVSIVRSSLYKIRPPWGQLKSVALEKSLCVTIEFAQSTRSCCHPIFLQSRNARCRVFAKWKKGFRFLILAQLGFLFCCYFFTYSCEKKKFTAKR